jgi:tetratricopeptide (TPR) repeat protein
LYREVMDCYPKLREQCARAALQLAGSYQSGRQIAQAVAGWTEIREKYADTWEAGAAGIHLGRYHAEMGDTEQAVKTLEAVVSDFAGTDWLAAPALEEIALIQARAKDFSRAQQILEQLLADYPNQRKPCASAQLGVARLYAKAREYARAEALLKAVWSGYPDLEEAAAAGIELANIFKNFRRYQEALEILDRVQGAFGGSDWWARRTLERRAQVLLASGDLSAAEQVVEQLLASDAAARPLVAGLLLSLGDAYRQRGEVQQAIRLYRKVGGEFVEQEEAWARAVAKLAVLGENEAVAELIGQSPGGMEKARSGIAREKVERAYKLQEEDLADEAIQVCQEVLREFPEERESGARALLYWAFSLGASTAGEPGTAGDDGVFAGVAPDQALAIAFKQRVREQ